MTRHTSARLDRRQVVKSLGLAGAGLVAGCGRPFRSASGLARAVADTAFIDTHEHLSDEVDRLGGRALPCDDWSLLLYDYVSSDLASAGMPLADRQRLFGSELDPLAKWRLVEPFWPRVRHGGFAQAVRRSVRALYGIDDLRAETIGRLQEAYEERRRGGFYEQLLVETARVESCQVNTQQRPFHETRQPTLLMQDLSFQTLHSEPDIEAASAPTGIAVTSLADWHAVIHWWFDKYSRYAVAAKSQGAYLRGLNYRRVEAEVAEPLFARVLAGESLAVEEKKLLEDHLFWFCVDKASGNRLPVKIHTGYLAGDRLSQFRRITEHTRDVIELCRRSPETTFVFLHMGYPNWHELIAVAKRFANAHVDMSWAWILDPVGSQEFLKRYLVSAPASKLYTFGGDYSVVECVVGHAEMAREGLAQALTELVNEGWLDGEEARALVEPLMAANARETFRLDEKRQVLSQAPWL